MRMQLRWLAAALLAGGVGMTAVEAHAERATCDTILRALAAGQSAAQIAASEQTTHARVSACQQVTAHREALATQHGHLADVRDARLAARR